jgi:hypothetical protein
MSRPPRAPEPAYGVDPRDPFNSPIPPQHLQQQPPHHQYYDDGSDTGEYDRRDDGRGPGAGPGGGYDREHYYEQQGSYDPYGNNGKHFSLCALLATFLMDFHQLIGSEIPIQNQKLTSTGNDIPRLPSL